MCVCGITFAILIVFIQNSPDPRSRSNVGVEFNSLLQGLDGAIQIETGRQLDPDLIEFACPPQASVRDKGFRVELDRLLRFAARQVAESCGRIGVCDLSVVKAFCGVVRNQSSIGSKALPCLAISDQFRAGLIEPDCD